MGSGEGFEPGWAGEQRGARAVPRACGHAGCRRGAAKCARAARFAVTQLLTFDPTPSGGCVLQRLPRRLRRRSLGGARPRALPTRRERGRGCVACGRGLELGRGQRHRLAPARWLECDLRHVRQRLHTTFPTATARTEPGRARTSTTVPSWSYTLAGNVNDKLELEHAGAALYVASNGDPILYFSADRIRAERRCESRLLVLQGERRSGAGPRARASPGPHQNGDVLIESDFAKQPGEHLEHRRQGVAERRALGTARHGRGLQAAGRERRALRDEQHRSVGSAVVLKPKAQSTAPVILRGGY